MRQSHKILENQDSTVVRPFMGDQPYWGSRVHALGAGPQPIPQKKLTVDNLAAALTTATTDPAMREKAETAGEQIRQENGVSDAVAIIEGILQTRQDETSSI